MSACTHLPSCTSGESKCSTPLYTMYPRPALTMLESTIVCIGKCTCYRPATRASSLSMRGASLPPIVTPSASLTQLLTSGRCFMRLHILEGLKILPAISSDVLLSDKLKSCYAFLHQWITYEAAG